MAVVRAGVAWFTEEQWPEYGRMMSDFSGESYASWRQHLDRLEKRLTQKGVTVIRVPIDLSEFDFWCAVNRRPRDSEARSDYAAAQMDKPR